MRDGRTVRRRVGTLLVAALLATATLPAAAWDSIKWNPTHPTHSYLTEYAIGRAAQSFPEVAQYRAALLAGANTELHELPVSGSMYGVDLNAKRIEHRGTNEGTADIRGWWNEAVAAYRAGNREQAYFYVGIMLHMIEDMGVPAHAHRLYHQGSPTEFDNFEFIGLSNWKPDFSLVDRADPRYAEPWRYYDFSSNWTLADAPSYPDRDFFAKFWVTASSDERRLLSGRQARTAAVASWALSSAAAALR